MNVPTSQGPTAAAGITAAQEAVDAVYRAQSRRVFATLIRQLGDFDLAEEALHEAFMAALEQWPRDGIPANPRAWLVSAGRFKAIDTIRRRARFDASMGDIAQQIETHPSPVLEGETYLQYGRFRRELGDHAEARACFERAQELFATAQDAAGRERAAKELAGTT